MTSPPVDGAGHLLEAATRLFASKRAGEVSVREILREAGVGPTVLYYHFGSKDGLYAAVLAREASDYDAAIARAAESDDDPVERILHVCRVHAAFPGHAPDHHAAATLRRLIEEGNASGAIAPCDAESLAVALVGVADVLAHERGAAGRDRFESTARRLLGATGRERHE